MNNEAATAQEHVKPNVFHAFDNPRWKLLFEHEDQCVIRQSNVDIINMVVFYPHFTNEIRRFYHTVAVFNVKRKITNMMIADEIINNAIKNEAV